MVFKLSFILAQKINKYEEFKPNKSGPDFIPGIKNTVNNKAHPRRLFEMVSYMSRMFRF